ncbi:MAG: MBL fold metallo-hydrolase [Holosporales bacterium]|jgi:L-ascorbate metabolism protein UlaG (beta-lactamase superfamily)|nr:MBL fold metallo-hydrolase [Holosporales bacterium]
MKFVLTIVSVILVSVITYIHTPKFGSLPDGNRLERIKKSTNYKNGQFHNIHPKDLAKPVGFLKTCSILFKIILSIVGNQEKARNEIPSTKTNLINLNKMEDVLIWFGHSSYFIQIEGLRIMVDPVFSEVSSPIPFFPKAFPGTNVYTTSDIPDIDYLVITHDHWDHLDYETVKKLKISKIICPLGVGAHLERWGFNKEIIIEMDWHETVVFDNGFKIHCLPARHFSGRGFLRNKSLWASFLMESPNCFKIFMGGDGGYDTHFRDIGKKFNSIDLAVLENGQYNENWKNIHMHPKETIRAAKDLKARAVLPVHNSKFALSTHLWYEPLENIVEFGKELKILTPMIGEKVDLKNKEQKFKKWWR